VITTERHKVSLSGRVKSLQSPRHLRRLRSIKAPLKPKNGLNGPPVLSSLKGCTTDSIRIAMTYTSRVRKKMTKVTIPLELTRITQT
jgi:hypothetical protein